MVYLMIQRDLRWQESEAAMILVVRMKECFSYGEQQLQDAEQATDDDQNLINDLDRCENA